MYYKKNCSKQKRLSTGLLMLAIQQIIRFIITLILASKQRDMIIFPLLMKHRKEAY